ncbi:unnamed protein product, partial [marine sediment metagenome]
KGIKKRDINVLLERFGVNSYGTKVGWCSFSNKKTLKQVGIKFNLSRERIRQIERNVMSILKENYKLKKIYKDM